MSNMEHVSKQMLTQTLSISAKEITGNLDVIIKNNLKDRLEGICSEVGYILPESINIIKRNIGMIQTRNNKSKISYLINYSADVLSPSEGETYEVYVNNINKMGVISYIKLNDSDTHETSPLIIMIPKDFMDSSILNIEDLHIGQRLKVIIVGSRIKIYSDKIQVVARPVS